MRADPHVRQFDLVASPYDLPLAALSPSPQNSALMSPSSDSLTASNSMRAFTGSARTSQTG